MGTAAIVTYDSLKPSTRWPSLELDIFDMIHVKLVTNTVLYIILYIQQILFSITLTTLTMLTYWYMPLIILSYSISYKYKIYYFFCNFLPFNHITILIPSNSDNRLSLNFMHCLFSLLLHSTSLHVNNVTFF